MDEMTFLIGPRWMRLKIRLSYRWLEKAVARP